MSDKQTAAKDTAYYLRYAKGSLDSASQMARKTGDAKLTAQVTKLAQETETLANDITVKCDPTAG